MTIGMMQDDEYSGQLNLGVWKKLLVYVRPYRRHFLMLLAVALVLAGVQAMFTLLTREIYDEVTSRGVEANLVPYGIAYLALLVVSSFTVMLFIRLAGRISTGISHDIRQSGFNHLQELSFSFYDRRPSGWLVARLTSDCDRLSRTLAWGALDIAWGTCMVIAIGSIMLVVNWKLGLLVLAIVPAVAWVSLIFQKRILNASRAVRKQNSNITAAFSECLAGVRTTKTLVREADNMREFQDLTKQMYGNSVWCALLSAGYIPIVLTLGSLAAGLALWAGGVQTIAGTLSIGTLIMFVAYSGQLFFPIVEMAQIFADLQGTQAAAERIFGLIDTEPQVKDTAEVLAAISAHRGQSPQKGLAIDGMPNQIHEVRFREVNFAYNHGQPVLNNFNLTVKAGQTIALTGSTGGGKSTIVNLLCRFYEPTSGEILINTMDYRKRSLKWLQSNLGMVLQQPHLFSGTISQNIRYGRLDASDEEITEAARMVRAHDFIMTLENGYDTEVGEAGVKLSTGQKQLVSFARAILADPQIFVMDEATSSVDTETEQLIQQGLTAVLQGRISFIIAHRLSTIRSADVILVIDEGKIAEQGNHHELIQQKGRYYELYTSQFAEEKTSEILGHGTE